MTKPVQKKLSAEEITHLSSPFLDTGIRQEKWEILGVKISGRTLTSSVKMNSLSPSSTDPGGFHLTPYSTLEFLSQLSIIYMHVWAGYTEKKKEVWMHECSVRCNKSIRNAENIQIEMKVPSIRKVGEKIFCVTTSRVFDQHGDFEARLKGILS